MKGGSLASSDHASSPAASFQNLSISGFILAISVTKTYASRANVANMHLCVVKTVDVRTWFSGRSAVMPRSPNALPATSRSTSSIGDLTPPSITFTSPCTII